MYIYSIIIQFCISDTTKRLQRYNFFFVSFNIYRKMHNFARKFTTKMNETAQHMLLYSPIFFIIIGISLFLLFITLGIPQGYTTVVLSHITSCLPYVILSVMPRLKQMNPNLYEAALDLGGGIVIFLLAVVLALTIFVAIKKYEHYKHRRLSRKHRRRHVVKVKG